MLNWKVKNVKSEVQLAQLIDQRFRFITLIDKGENFKMFSPERAIDI